MPAGRPTKGTEDLMNAICERLANGEPLARICDDPDMPSFQTVWRWENENEEFRDRSTRARRHGTHYMADDCIRISDDPSLEPSDKRVRIDTRLRLIGKWNRKDYGDKQEIEHSGGTNNTVSLAGLSVEQLEAIAAAGIDGAA